MNSRKALDEFYASLEKCDVLDVERQLKAYSHDTQRRIANQPYLEELPLSVAIGHGDVDMAALLLVTGADPNKSLHDVQSPRLHAQQTLARPSSRYTKEVALIVRMMDDPDDAEEHWAAARTRVKRETIRFQNRRRQALMLCWVTVVIPIILVYLTNRFLKYIG